MAISSGPRAPVDRGHIVRRADSGDVPELIRLRHAMFREMAATGVAARPDLVADASWYPAAATVFVDQLRAGAAAAFVIGTLTGGPIAACAAATLEQRLPGPGSPTGRSGNMSSVFVEPHQRGRGLARAVVTAALEWLDQAGVETIDIHATPAAAHLYRSLGFTEPRSVPLRRLAVSHRRSR